MTEMLLLLALVVIPLVLVMVLLLLLPLLVVTLAQRARRPAMWPYTWRGSSTRYFQCSNGIAIRLRDPGPSITGCEHLAPVQTPSALAS